MDFFEAQDESRRITRLLVVFFTLAVVSIVLLVNLLVMVVLNYSNTETMVTGRFVVDWRMFAGIGAAVVALIAGGSFYRIFSLSGGGARVAEMMEGELLVDHGGDLAKRRLLNVVEEMAIASGTPVPPVYIIPDEAINAFAAGYTPGDAVIGVTEGTLRNLDRDQLQGVIAHEFSHILNGDMRLNIRLMGVLFGILMLAVVGRILIHSGRGTRHSSSRRSGSAILLIAVGLLVIGYVGRLFGNIIKAAVSRQREFLADAAAVQFTRNPDGIAGALKRIGGFAGGSRLHHAEAEEYSHAFFSLGVKPMLGFGSLLATHPPLAERIGRIDPNWDGSWISAAPASAREERETALETEAAAISGFSGAASGGGAAAGTAIGPASSVGNIDVNAAVASIGQPNASQLAQARELIDGIPKALAEAARETYSARAVVYLVLLDRDELVQRRQLDHLAESADVFVMARFRELLPLVTEISPEMRLPLVEMALSPLRQLSDAQYDRFIGNVDALIRADNSIALTEWALHKYLVKHLGEAFGQKTPSHGHPRKLADVREECGVLLSMLAYSDRYATVLPDIAFAAGKAVLEEDIRLEDKSSLTLTRMNNALDTLASLRPLRKPKLLKACIATVTADRTVAPVEKELVRTIADCLDCPMPPLP